MYWSSFQGILYFRGSIRVPEKATLKGTPEVRGILALPDFNEGLTMARSNCGQAL